MKQLKEYILESIFDTDSVIKDTHLLEKQQFEDYNSDFWKFLEPQNLRGEPLSVFQWERERRDMDLNKDIINLPDMELYVSGKYKNPFVNKYYLNCKSFFIGSRTASGSYPESITDGAGFKEICVNSRLQIDGTAGDLRGFKFKLQGTVKALIYCGDNLKKFEADFDFTNPDDPQNGIISFSSLTNFPNLLDVTSNASTLTFYGASLFDNQDIKTKMDKFFGKGTITANGVTKTKNTRNIVAIVNNMRKYGAIVPTEVIPEGKLSDLIDIHGFKNLQKVIIRNNNVKLMFIKKPDEKMIDRQARFIRLNNMKLFKDTPIEEIAEIVKQCQTKDGWLIIFEPEQY